MRFLSRIMGSVLESSHVRHERRSVGRRRSRIELEKLETRELMSVQGVTLSYGNLLIKAPKSSGNVAVVAIDPSNHNVQVSLNGASEEFSPSLVANITYYGASGGGDTFTDDTSLVSLDYAFGQHNNFTGGTSYNYVFFYGGNNTFNAQAGSVSDLYEDGGGDTIKNPYGAIIQIW